MSDDFKSESKLSKRHAWGRLLLRILIGWVFLSEGIQKFLFPAALGAGRFAKLGIPFPQYMGPFVGVVEIISGLILLGLYTSFAAVPLLFVIAVAIATTKTQTFLKQGFWNAMHEGRTDFCMLVGLVALICLGSGPIAIRRNAGERTNVGT